jgi:predicted amidohydrolase
MNTEALAEKRQQGITHQWMAGLSNALGCMVMGSFIVEQHKKYYNQLQVVNEGRLTATGNKRHLFRMGDEHNFYTPGLEKVIVDYQGWRMLPLICYDLRFPVWSRNREDYDVLVYLSNWPQKRINDWHILLRARAIENQSYVAGVNRIGADGRGIDYNGHSVVLDSRGNSISEGQLLEKESLIVATLNKQQLLDHRRDFPILQDRDSFSIRPR